MGPKAGALCDWLPSFSSPHRASAPPSPPPRHHRQLIHNNVFMSPHVFLCKCTVFWSYYARERSHAGRTGSMRQLWNVQIVILKARRHLFDSRLMRRTGKPLVVGRLTPFSSLMRFDRNRLRGEENSFLFLIYLFSAFKLCSSPKCAVTLAAALKHNRFEWSKWTKPFTSDFY